MIDELIRGSLIELLSRPLADASQNGRALFRLALWLEDIGFARSACAAYQRAAELAADIPEFQFRLSRSLQRSGQYGGAVSAFCRFCWIRVRNRLTGNKERDVSGE